MIAAWLVYSIALALLVGVAASALELALRLYRMPARGVWVAAMIASVAVPVLALTRPQLSVAPSRPVTTADVSLTATVTAELEALLGSLESGLASLDGPLIVAWAALSVLLVGVLVWSFWRLRRERRWWRPAEIGNGSFLVSGDTGPAVVGVLGSTVVMPKWVLGLRTDQQELILRHEMEHLKAGDLRLMLGALAICVAVPWCLPLWWQLRRIRSAIEADCDRRVVQGGVGIAQYAAVLLDVGRRAGRCTTPVLAFSNNKSALARRIDLMTWKPRRRFAQLSVALAAVFGLILVACETPTPEQAVDVPLEAAQVPADAAADARLTVQVEEGLDGEGQGDPVSHIRIQPTEPLDGPGPLILIDEKEATEAAMRELDPDDIDRIEVIKGAAAEALMGERGKGGVIQIVLKKQ